MKKLSIIFMTMLLLGCGSMSARNMGDSSGPSGAPGTSSFGQRFPGMDPTFDPYYGG